MSNKFDEIIKEEKTEIEFIADSVEEAFYAMKFGGLINIPSEEFGNDVWMNFCNKDGSICGFATQLSEGYPDKEVFIYEYAQLIYEEKCRIIIS